MIGPAEPLLPVGSLQKPFVVKAWALSHPTDRPPRLRCDASSHCWRPDGHGEVGLSSAVAVSCNTYFQALAAATPEGLLESALREEGFVVQGPLSPEGAVGKSDASVAIRPGALLRAYVRVTREPWSQGEDVRRGLLAGLRESALTGTAKGLGRRGFWAKTGTVPALDGRPLHTSGFVAAVDDAGLALLGLLPDGTGREAARALSAELTRPTHGSDGAAALAPAPLAAEGGSVADAIDRVTVSLLGGLRPRAVLARNVGSHPLATSRGYVGVGAVTSLRPGDRLSEGRWSLSVPGFAFRREILAGLACDEGEGHVLRVRGDVALEEYVAGVLGAELPEGNGRLRLALGAAVLRFLADGPRHGSTQVCDSTHCAWFIGRGPNVLWPTPRTPVMLAHLGRDEGANAASDATPLDTATWEQILEGARSPGPRQWTSHCGGEPLSAHAVWGNGDRRVWACARHRTLAPGWTRRWPGKALAAVIGRPVRGVAVAEVDGVWTMRVETAAGLLALHYDDAHRRLAGALGWDALPSPAGRVVRDGDGWRAEGVGEGHRVGVCLGDASLRTTP